MLARLPFGPIGVGATAGVMPLPPKTDPIIHEPLAVIVTLPAAGWSFQGPRSAP
jgi:hypothetical protein